MDKTSGGDNGRHNDPKERFADFEPSPLPPIAPDGGFVSQKIGKEIPIPDATPRNFVCLRGPCRHYFELTTTANAGNRGDTWEGKEPRQINRACLVNPGFETELTDDVAFDCNLWDPMTPREVMKRARRQAKYFKKNPHHNPNKE